MQQPRKKVAQCAFRLWTRDEWLPGQYGDAIKEATVGLAGTRLFALRHWIYVFSNHFREFDCTEKCCMVRLPLRAVLPFSGTRICVSQNVVWSRLNFFFQVFDLKPFAYIPGLLGTSRSKSIEYHLDTCEFSLALLSLLVWLIKPKKPWFLRPDRKSVV